MAFNLSSIRPADTADCVITDLDGNAWTITLAGPAHPKTQAAADRAARKRLREQQEIERARVNGRKYAPPERGPEDERLEAVKVVVDRMVGWSGLTDDSGAEVPFSEATASAILADPAYGSIFSALVDFLTAEGSFTKRSAAI